MGKRRLQRSPRDARTSNNKLVVIRIPLCTNHSVYRNNFSEEKVAAHNRGALSSLSCSTCCSRSADWSVAKAGTPT
jgi:hypothetical protein